MHERLPLVVVTGFLGSGKTTLVRRFLERPEGAGTGVIVNEFGETGLDHRLFVHAADQVELVAKGCLCCARRADISRALHELVRQSRSANLGFARVIIETSGLADPSPIIATLADDPWMRAHFELTRVVAVLDSVAGLSNLETFAEARRQIGIADTVVVTKGDMRTAVRLDLMSEAVQRLAADSEIFDAQQPDFPLASLFFKRARPYAGVATSRFAAAAVDHDGAVGSFVLSLPDVVDWAALTVWLSALLHKHGDRILRVKGLIRTSSSQDVVAIHGVQHTMHAPSHIKLADDDGWPSFLVFIATGLEKDVVARSLAGFLEFAGDAADALPPLSLRSVTPRAYQGQNA